MPLHEREQNEVGPYHHASIGYPLRGCFLEPLLGSSTCAILMKLDDVLMALDEQDRADGQSLCKTLVVREALRTCFLRRDSGSNLLSRLAKVEKGFRTKQAPCRNADPELGIIKDLMKKKTLGESKSYILPRGRGTEKSCSCSKEHPILLDVVHGGWILAVAASSTGSPCKVLWLVMIARQSCQNHRDKFVPLWISAIGPWRSP